MQHETIYLIGGIADGQIIQAPANAGLVQGNGDGAAQLYEVVTFVAGSKDNRYHFGIPTGEQVQLVMETLLQSHFRKDRARLN